MLTVRQAYFIYQLEPQQICISFAQNLKSIKSKVNKEI